MIRMSHTGYVMAVTAVSNPGRSGSHVRGIHGASSNGE